MQARRAEPLGLRAGRHSQRAQREHRCRQRHREFFHKTLLFACCVDVGSHQVVAFLRHQVCGWRLAYSSDALSHNSRRPADRPEVGTWPFTSIAVLRFDAAAVEVAFGPAALNPARRAGETGAGLALDGLFNGEGEIAVGTGREMPRQVAGRTLMIPRLVPPLARYPQ